MGAGDQVEDGGWVSVGSRPGGRGWTVIEVAVVLTSRRGVRKEGGNLVWLNRGRRTKQVVGGEKRRCN